MAVKAREIFDSRGNPTVEVDLCTATAAWHIWVPVSASRESSLKFEKIVQAGLMSLKVQGIESIQPPYGRKIPVILRYHQHGSTICSLSISQS